LTSGGTLRIVTGGYLRLFWRRPPLYLKIEFPKEACIGMPSSHHAPNSNRLLVIILASYLMIVLDRRSDGGPRSSSAGASA
jgi:hypothetical protein